STPRSTTSSRATPSRIAITTRSSTSSRWTPVCTASRWSWPRGTTTSSTTYTRRTARRAARRTHATSSHACAPPTTRSPRSDDSTLVWVLDTLSAAQACRLQPAYQLTRRHLDGPQCDRVAPQLARYVVVVAVERAPRKPQLFRERVELVIRLIAHEMGPHAIA